VGGGSRGVLGGGLVFGFIGVLGNTFVFDISDKSIFVVSGVGHGLDTAIGKVDTVRTLKVSVVILGFGLFEVGARVVIGNSVLVGEGLGREFFHGVGGVFGGGGVGRGGFVGWGWGSVGPGGGNGEESGNDGGLHFGFLLM